MHLEKKNCKRQQAQSLPALSENLDSPFCVHSSRFLQTIAWIIELFELEETLNRHLVQLSSSEQGHTQLHQVLSHGCSLESNYIEDVFLKKAVSPHLSAKWEWEMAPHSVVQGVCAMQQWYLSAGWLPSYEHTAVVTSHTWLCLCFTGETARAFLYREELLPC